jgi:hypothetical protein
MVGLPILSIGISVGESNYIEGTSIAEITALLKKLSQREMINGRHNKNNKVRERKWVKRPRIRFFSQEIPLRPFSFFYCRGQV